MWYNFQLSDFQFFNKNTNELSNYTVHNDCPVARLAKREGLTNNPTVSLGSLGEKDTHKKWAVGDAIVNEENTGIFCGRTFWEIEELVKEGKFESAQVEIIEK